MAFRVLPFGTTLLAAAALLLPAAAHAATGGAGALPLAERGISQDADRVPAVAPAAARAVTRVVTTSAAPVAWPGLPLRENLVALLELTPRQPTARPAPRPTRPRWSPPVADAPISQPFGRPDPGYAAGYHTGVDFAVPVGTPVLAVADATVRAAGAAGAYGNEVKLTLPDGKVALYAHLSRIGVHTGEQVKTGTRVGASGDTGNSTGPHLHFEIRTADAYGAVIDPLPYLLHHGARLRTAGDGPAAP